jgi:glycosyltransferase involved in cell wall biosynthesis
MMERYRGEVGRMAIGEVLTTSEHNAALSSPPACAVTVVVPTYCEGTNLPLLVPRIAAALEQAGLAGEIVVVDDDSPDDTQPAGAELARMYPLRLFVRTGVRGLSSAVVHGMRQARDDVIVVMDADLSHPPEAIGTLVDAVRSGDVDFAIGSRYVAGGSTGAEWGWVRWVNSRIATLLARPLISVRDPLAGFFAVRRSTFLAAGPLDPVGFKIGLEVMVKCGCRRIKEIPIAFHDRAHGHSKLTLRERLDYLRHLARLYKYKIFGPKGPGRANPELSSRESTS